MTVPISCLAYVAAFVIFVSFAPTILDSFIVRANGRNVTVGAFPISIDHDMVAAEASRPQTVDLVKTIKNGISGSQMILVSRINGYYSTSRWVPIHYFYRSIPIRELVAFYRASDIAMVTPLRDGMNLISKEFCAARVDNRGVLMLSEFAGSADELKCGALLVNPHNSLQMTQMLARALKMHESEQAIRMNKMRLRVRQNDVFHWFQRVIAQNPTWTSREIARSESLVVMGS